MNVKRKLHYKLTKEDIMLLLGLDPAKFEVEEINWNASYSELNMRILASSKDFKISEEAKVSNNER